MGTVIHLRLVLLTPAPTVPRGGPPETTEARPLVSLVGGAELRRMAVGSAGKLYRLCVSSIISEVAD